MNSPIPSPSWHSHLQTLACRERGQQHKHYYCTWLSLSRSVFPPLLKNTLVRSLLNTIYHPVSNLSFPRSLRSWRKYVAYLSLLSYVLYVLFLYQALGSLSLWSWVSTMQITYLLLLYVYIMKTSANGRAVTINQLGVSVYKHGVTILTSFSVCL